MAPIRCPFTSCKWTVLNGTTARKLRHLGNCSSCGFIWLTILLNSQMFYSFVFWPLIRIPPLNHSLTLYSDAISHEIILLPVRKKNIFAIGILWFLSTFSHLKSLSIFCLYHSQPEQFSELFHQRESHFKCLHFKCAYAGPSIDSLRTHLRHSHAR